MAKKFYKNTWRGNEKPSPALNDKIVRATNYGFRHLVGKTKTSGYADAIKRLNHLPNAKQILENTEFVYETKKEFDKNKLINRYAILGRLENGLVLKVIVKEIDDKLFFVSAYPSIQIKNG